ncbi:SGNH hydrolase-type esterase domain-containing protein [Xylariales sp. PMI_506]|nr:SGNH hydrolase-type esterase domain-containing protein [Xylariales sp. PMI_506]
MDRFTTATAITTAMWIFTLLCFAPLVSGTMLARAPSHDFHSKATSLSLGERDGSRSVPARVLALGASITWGYNTRDGNSFRKPVRDLLQGDGWTVEMVGSKQHGTMSDNYVEAHPGDTIAEIHTASFQSIKYQPNIVLIHAGINDCHLNVNTSFAGYRMGLMLDDLFEKIPGVTLILSTMIVSTNAKVNMSWASVNQQFRDLVAQRQAKKQKVVLAEMAGSGPIYVQSADLTSDGIHPTDAGDAKMGRIFYETINTAFNNSLITVPNPSSDVKPATGGSSSSHTTAATKTTSGFTTTLGAILAEGPQNSNSSSTSTMSSGNTTIIVISTSTPTPYTSSVDSTKPTVTPLVGASGSIREGDVLKWGWAVASLLSFITCAF